VQDGDVPVTVLRREPGQDATATRTGSATTVPTTSRLQQLETALASEAAGRAQAERALAAAQALLLDLQTKIGHAELAKTEARTALARDGEVIAGLRRELETVCADAEATRLRAVEAERRVADHEAVIAEERQTRRSLQQSLQAAKAAGDEAERRLQTFSATVSEPVAQASRADEVMSAPKISPIKKRGRQAIVHQPTLPQFEAEPEPVKWWLTPPKTAIRRR
jgi:chromosome segregation ATPase